MITGFEPKNDVEQQLPLLGAQLFMPVKDDDSKIKGFQRSNLAQPLSLQAEDGRQVLVPFTSPERAKSFVKDYPGYEGGLLTEFKWILERGGSGYGIALNPGREVGIDFDSETVQQLIAMAQDTRTH